MNTSTRLFLGFLAGALSHIVFQGALGLVYYALDLIPGVTWSLAPVPPYGVPRTVNFAFWAGLWGIAYGALAPNLLPRLGLLLNGLLFGVAALLVRWFVVLPLQGLPVAEGFQSPAVGIYVGFHLIFGLGLALIYAAFATLAGSSSDERSVHLRG